MSIVLVDDETTYANLMSRMLEENLGCKVVTFTRPLDALSALPALTPPLVITDYFMPQLNGLDFIRQGAALVPGTHFLLITGHNLSAVHDEMAELTALRGVVAKPFGWRTLASEVMRVWPSHTPTPIPPAGALVP